jgi:hypothetical protein
VAAVSGLQGLTKELVLALVNVRPEAACRTCCLAGIIESSNFARKSVPRIGVELLQVKIQTQSCGRQNRQCDGRGPRRELLCR